MSRLHDQLFGAPLQNASRLGSNGRAKSLKTVTRSTYDSVPKRRSLKPKRRTIHVWLKQFQGRFQNTVLQSSSTSSTGKQWLAGQGSLMRRFRPLPLALSNTLLTFQLRVLMRSILPLPT